MTGREKKRRIARRKEIGAIIQLAAGAEGILSCHRSQPCRRGECFHCILVSVCVCAAPSHCFVAAYFVRRCFPTHLVLPFPFILPILFNSTPIYLFLREFQSFFITNIHLPPSRFIYIFLPFLKTSPTHSQVNFAWLSFSLLLVMLQRSCGNSSIMPVVL